MAKLFFYYGAMNSSKTANLLMTKYNYEERGQFAFVCKSSLDTRDGDKIESRIGLKCDIDLSILETTNIFNEVKKEIEDGLDINAILFDEVQFLSPAHVWQITRIVDELNIPALCYGLRVDFKGKLFPACEILMAQADVLRELVTVCWCGKKAIANARLVNGLVVKDGKQFQLGKEDSYVALCREHWKTGTIKSGEQAIVSFKGKELETLEEISDLEMTSGVIAPDLTFGTPLDDVNCKVKSEEEELFKDFYLACFTIPCPACKSTMNWNNKTLLFECEHEFCKNKVHFKNKKS